MEENEEETALVEDLEKSEAQSEDSAEIPLTPVDADVPELQSKDFSTSNSLQTKYIGAIVASTSLGCLLWGYHISIMAGAMLLIDDHYDLNVLWHEIIVSILLGGATIGAAIAGWLSDKFGRWKMMMCTAVLYGVAAIVLVTSFSKFCLVVGRAIAGLALGLYSVIGPVYVSEMSPSHIRGNLGLANYISSGVGLFSGSVSSGLFSIDSEHAYTFGWRYMFGLGVIPSIVMCVCLLFLFETPRWLVFHGKVDKAREVMRKIRSDDMVEEELNDIVNDYELTSKNAIGTIQFIKKVFHSRILLYTMFIGCSLQIFQVFSGIAIILSYSSGILKTVGFSLREAIWFSAVPTGVNLLMKTFTSFLVERTGRRKLYNASGICVTLCLTLLATSFLLGNNSSPSAVPLHEGGRCDFKKCGNCVTNSHCGFCTVKVDGEYLYGTCSEGSKDHADVRVNNSQCVTWNETVWTNETSNITSEWYFDHCPDNKFAIFSLVVMILLVASTSSGLVTLPWVINSEIYPTWARGPAVSFSSLVNWILNLLVVVTFLSLVDALGLPTVVFMYATITFIGVIFTILLLPETSKQSLEKIEVLFSRPYFLTWCDNHGCRKHNNMYSVVEMEEQTTKQI
ncbi:proton myo-inositol cotransporter hmit-1.3-like [Dysidea avara]|uniref:proton myo-inositol cotransporter hmit-1.3-like n=1 Tax=Dysidea avara TaxID=196820 RepID=UPI00331DCB8A